MKTTVKKVPVLHPFLFLLYPIFALYISNYNQVEISQTLRPLIVSVMAVSILFLLLARVLKDWQRAGLISSLLILLFYSLGHVVSLFADQGAIKIPANFLAAVWAAAAILGSWSIARLMKRFHSEGTRMINLVSAFTILACCSNFVLKINPRTLYPSSLTIFNPQKNGTPDSPQIPLTGTAGDTNSPDIYYLILDGYGRSDVLNEVYGVDNSEFIHFLRSRGFFVADESQTNYPQTALSLSSSLNYEYLDDLMEVDPLSNNRHPLDDLKHSSAAMRFLKQNGYQFVTFASHVDSADNPEVDIQYEWDELVNPFEWMLLRGSAAAFWVDRLLYDDFRYGLLNTFDEIKQAVHLSGPKFVFAHVVVPHPPFVFDQDGSSVYIGSNTDGSYFGGTRDEYLKGYRGQVIYIDQVYEEIIDSILKNSKTPPIILLQGDHGPGAYLDWTSLEKTCLKERMSILNAYYLPGEKTGALYPTISPVNSFRVVLNEYFEQDLPLLPDRQFFALWETPYQWTEVTGQTNGSCPPWTGEVLR